MRRNFHSQFLNVYWISDIRQTEIQIHTAEPLVPEGSAKRMKRQNSPVIGQIPTELFKQEAQQFFLRSINLHNINQQKHTIL
jgi:hypothetical protein